MTVEEIKKLNLFVKHVMPDVRPNAGLRRLQYFVYIDQPREYYFGLSFRRPYTDELMNAMVEKGQVIELKEAARLEYEKDLFLDSAGNVIMATAWNPVKDKEQKIIGYMEKFKAGV